MKLKTQIFFIKEYVCSLPNTVKKNNYILNSSNSENWLQNVPLKHGILV